MKSRLEKLHNSPCMSRRVKLLICTSVLFLFIWMNVWNWSIKRDPCELMQKRNKDSTLPKYIHQQWKNADVPPMFHDNDFKRLFPAPEFTYMLWTDESMRNLIKDKFPWFLATYDGYPRNIQRADAVRYFIMYEYGGLYADMDYEPLGRFWEYLPDDQPGLIESPYTFDSILQNSLMSSPRHHPFWNMTFDLMMQLAPTEKGVLQSTGPNMLQIAYHENPQYLLPCENFHRIPWGDDTLFITNWFRYVMSWTWMVKPCGNVADTRCQLGIHHNVASWTKIV